MKYCKPLDIVSFFLEGSVNQGGAFSFAHTQVAGPTAFVQVLCISEPRRGGPVSACVYSCAVLSLRNLGERLAFLSTTICLALGIEKSKHSSI